MIVLETPKSKDDTSNISNKEKRSIAKGSSIYGEKKKQISNTKHYCNQHGNNPTHSPADCWKPKNDAKRAEHLNLKVFLAKNLSPSRILSYPKTIPKGRRIIDTSYPDHSVYPVENHSNWMELYPDASEEIPKDLPLEKGPRVRKGKK
jgi:hypothetical protein